MFDRRMSIFYRNSRATLERTSKRHMPTSVTDRSVLAQRDLTALAERVEEGHLRERLHTQANHAAKVFGRGKTLFHTENTERKYIILHYLLKLTRLYARGKRNFLDVRVKSHRVSLRKLAERLNGFTLLQLSDLHLDIDTAITERVIEKLSTIDYDLCVITGDFRASSTGDYDSSLSQMRRLMEHLEPPVYGILGNHDFIEMVPGLEDMGIRMLLNEQEAVEGTDGALYIAGIDDPYLYQSDDIERAVEGIPESAVSVLLSHSPETFRKAAAAGFDLMLSGHTHGGQICLPGGIPILHHGDCPRRMVVGSWEFHGMQGYTSAGTGSSGVPVRFCCPPEITLHTLARA